MKEFKFVITNQETGEQEEIEAIFEEEEWNILKEYKNYTDELFNISLLKKGFNSNLNVTYIKESGMKVKSSLPEWEDIIVFLHKIRPFVLNKETTYFYKIANIISKNIKNTFIRDFINRQRGLFSGKNMQKQVQIKVTNININLKIKNVIINSAEILNKWLNAYEYHRDNDKIIFIDKVNEVIPKDFSQAIFVSLLIHKGKAIGNIGSFIKLMMKEINE